MFFEKSSRVSLFGTHCIFTALLSIHSVVESKLEANKTTILQTGLLRTKVCKF